MTDKKDEWGNISLPSMSDEKLLNTNWNRIAGAREAVNAREQTGWKAKNEKRYEDPEYARRVAKSISETYSTPEGRKKQSDKQHPQTEETKQKLHLAFVGKIRKGEDWVADMAKTQKGNNFRAKPVITPMGVFASKKTAAAFYIDNEHTTRKTIPSVICWIDVQIKKPNSGFSFISKEEYIILTGKDI